MSRKKIKEIKPSDRWISPGRIIETCAKELNTYYAIMHSPTRKRSATVARHTAMYFMRVYTKLTLREIGERFGGRDHSSVSHALILVSNLCEVDNSYKLIFEIIKEKLENISIMKTEDNKSTKLNSEALRKAYSDEAIFTLLARDEHAPKVIVEWIKQSIYFQSPDKLHKALDVAIAMADQKEEMVERKIREKVKDREFRMDQI